MKHLTKQEAIRRMMLAQAIVIAKKIHCRLEWLPSFRQCILTIYLDKGKERCQLPILMHPDFQSFEWEDNEYYDRITYTWDSDTAAQ